MATGTSLSVARPEHRGLSFWMDRVVKELQNVRKSPEPDAVHDLRVAIRRCRSIASVMEEVDSDPSWPEMRKTAKKLFQGLGELRDAHILEEWVQKLGPETDPVRAQLLSTFEENETRLTTEALCQAEKFDEKNWKRLGRRLRSRQRLVPVGGLAAECLALERLEEAKELHTVALRSEKAKSWHGLRIGLKRLRYTVEGFLPHHYEAWGQDLKRVQDLLGDVHDLDVLSGCIKESDSVETEESRKFWRETIARERHTRIETYRHLTLGKTSLWNQWRSNLPTNGRLAEASLARLRSTAQASDSHFSRTSQISRIGLSIFDALRNAKVFPEFEQAPLRRIFLAASRLHNSMPANSDKAPQKAASKFVGKLTMPPGWSDAEWNLLGWTIRYHRGEEPNLGKKKFAGLSDREQNQIRALAGILRLARVFRKCGITTGSGFRIEKSDEAIVLHTPHFEDSPEIAARMAAGKHLLESVLPQPLLLKPHAPKIAISRSADTQTAEGTAKLEPLRFAFATAG